MNRRQFLKAVSCLFQVDEASSPALKWFYWRDPEDVSFPSGPPSFISTRADYEEAKRDWG